MRYIPYSKVVKCFRSVGLYSSPLLMPVDAIEAVLKHSKYLQKDETLVLYDVQKESFQVKTIERKPLSLLESFRLKIARKLLP